MRKPKAKLGRPPKPAAERAVLTFVGMKARARDIEVLEALSVKKGLDHSNVLRLALYHLAEFEGLSTVGLKGNPPADGAVSSAG